MEGLIPTGAPTDDMNGTLALPTPQATCLTAEGVFLSKNQSVRCIVVLSVGLKNNEGTDLINLDSNPWKSIPVTTMKPQKEDYAKEIEQQCVAEDLANRIGLKRLPQPRRWKKPKMLKWLQEYPITYANEVKYVTTVVLVRKEAAERFAASKAAVKEVEDKVGGAWDGPLPMLRLIMALVDSDEMRRAYISTIPHSSDSDDFLQSLLIPRVNSYFL